MITSDISRPLHVRRTDATIVRWQIEIKKRFFCLCEGAHKFSEIWGPPNNLERQAGDIEANSVLRTQIYYAPNYKKLVAVIKWRPGFVHSCIHIHIFKKKCIFIITSPSRIRIKTQLMASQRVPLRLSFHCQGKKCRRRIPLFSNEEDFFHTVAWRDSRVVPLKKTDVKEPLL